MRRRERGRAGTGTDREFEQLLVKEERIVLIMGLCRVRREAWVGRENPSLETSHRLGALDKSSVLKAKLSRAQ